MPGLSSLFGSKSTFSSLFEWQIAGALIGGLLAPYVRELENISFQANPTAPISPDEAARMVIRNVITLARGRDEAGQNGIGSDDFDLMVKATGNAPAPEQLAEALRRGFVPEDGDADGVSYRQGIREGDLKDKYADLIKRLELKDPTPADALDALLEGQLDKATAIAYFTRFGGNPDHFEWLFNTRGTAPTPTQLAELANRGIIPWEGTGPEATSFEQGFLEGPWRNKWLAPMRAGAEYFPPPRTITAMVRDGSLTDEQAIRMWKQQGLSDETAAAYLKSAHHERTATHRAVTLGVIESLYRERAISREQTLSLIGQLGYSPGDAEFIVETAELQNIQASINRAVTTVHTSYIGWRIDRAAASRQLDAVGIAAAQRDELLAIWDEERKARPHLLTPAEIRKAMRTNKVGPDGNPISPAEPILTYAQALDRLRALGYADEEAGIYLQL